MTIIMRVSFPKLADIGILDQVMFKGQESLAKNIKEDFEKTTETWDNKPKFVIELTPDVTKVYTESDIYRFVSRGTAPHTIVPKRSKWLHFQGYYKAKTTPRVIGSSGGGHEGPMTFRSSVSHPGAKAREFEETIAEKYGNIIGRETKKTVREALAAMGLHAV